MYRPGVWARACSLLFLFFFCFLCVCTRTEVDRSVLPAFTCLLALLVFVLFFCAPSPASVPCCGAFRLYHLSPALLSPPFSQAIPPPAHKRTLSQSLTRHFVLCLPRLSALSPPTTPSAFVSSPFFRCPPLPYLVCALCRPLKRWQAALNHFFPALLVCVRSACDSAGVPARLASQCSSTLYSPREEPASLFLTLRGPLSRLPRRGEALAPLLTAALLPTSRLLCLLLFVPLCLFSQIEPCVDTAFVVCCGTPSSTFPANSSPPPSASPAFCTPLAH